MRRKKECFQNYIFDVHTHCEGIDIYNYVNYLTPTVQDVFSLSEKIKNSKIDYAITFPIQSTVYYDLNSYIGKNVFKSSNICSYPYEIENKRMLLGIQKLESKNLLPFLSFSLNDKVIEQVKAMKELIRLYEIYGLKFHTQTDRNKADYINNYPELISFIEENDLPVMFHTGMSNVADPCSILDFADCHPNIRVCVAHFARFKKDFFERYTMNSYENVFLDIAPLDFLFESMGKQEKKDLLFLNGVKKKRNLIEVMYKKFPDKIIWGSDVPWIYPQNLQDKDLNYRIVHYNQVVDTLFEMDKKIIKQICNINTLRFVFG